VAGGTGTWRWPRRPRIPPSTARPTISLSGAGAVTGAQPCWQRYFFRRFFRTTKCRSTTVISSESSVCPSHSASGAPQSGHTRSASGNSCRCSSTGSSTCWRGPCPVCGGRGAGVSPFAFRFSLDAPNMSWRNVAICSCSFTISNCSCLCPSLPFSLAISATSSCNRVCSRAFSCSNSSAACFTSAGSLSFSTVLNTSLLRSYRDLHCKTFLIESGWRERFSSNQLTAFEKQRQFAQRQ
jgi:hypothetical protein